jgi:methionine-gamma-lyase
MDEIDETQLGPSTKAIHCGILGKENKFGPVNAPIYASSTFAYPSVEYGAKLFSGEIDRSEGFYYTRMGNPTVRDVECKLALIEGAEDACCFASGMAAIATAVFTMTKNGDHIIADHCLYGGTMALFKKTLPDFGIEVTFVDTSVLDDVKNAIQENTKLIFFESPVNPTMRLVPVKPLVKLAKEHNLLTAIDATFMSPILMKPIEMGVDVVIHSTTKFLNGHSDIVGGVVLGMTDFVNQVKANLSLHGGKMGPFEAYLLGRGLKTLKIRMDACESNAMTIATYLQKHPMIEYVNFIGLETHPQHALAKEQQNGFGSMMAFELKGSYDETKQFVNHLKLATRAVSLGGVETLISHPASTTHAVVPEEDRLSAGVTDGLMRLSIGLEETKDIIRDFEQAFEKVKANKTP